MGQRSKAETLLDSEDPVKQICSEEKSVNDVIVLVMQIQGEPKDRF